MNSATTKIYLFHQRHRVVLLDASGAYFDRRYRQVYTNNLIAHKGTDNQILIEFVNQDQKRVDLRKQSISLTATVAGSFIIGTEYSILTAGTTDFTLIGAADSNVGTRFTATAAGVGDGTAAAIDYTELQFTCRLISHDGSTLLLEKPLVMVNALVGQTKLVLTEQELDLIAPGTIGFSVEQTLDGSLYEPVFVTDNASARGLIKVVDSIMPSFTNSEVLTVPDYLASPYVSSVLNTAAAELHTFQFTMDQFSGTILAEGAVDTDGAWYAIQTESLASADLHIFSIAGYHPYIRFTMTDGIDVTAGAFVVGVEYTIVTTGTTDFTLIGAADSTPGTVFTANGPGVGTGTASPTYVGSITEIRHR